MSHTSSLHAEACHVCFLSYSWCSGCWMFKCLFSYSCFGSRDCRESGTLLQNGLYILFIVTLLGLTRWVALWGIPGFACHFHISQSITLLSDSLKMYYSFKIKTNLLLSVLILKVYEVWQRHIDTFTFLLLWRWHLPQNLCNLYQNMISLATTYHNFLSCLILLIFELLFPKD